MCVRLIIKFVSRMTLEGQLVLVRSSKLIILEDKAETFHLFFAIGAVDFKHTRQTAEGFDFFMNLFLFSGHIAPPFGFNKSIPFPHRGNHGDYRNLCAGGLLFNQNFRRITRTFLPVLRSFSPTKLLSFVRP